MYNVIVAGGGASGLTAAIFAAKNGYQVTILEHKDRVGKKILMTGNGVTFMESITAVISSRFKKFMTRLSVLGQTIREPFLSA